MEHSFQEYDEVGCVSTTLVLLQQVMSPVLLQATVHVAMSGQVSGVRGRGPDDTGLVIQAPDRGGEEGFLRALGAGERGRTASAGQGTRDLILRGRVTREPGAVPGVMFFGVCEGAQSAVHNLADRDGAGSAVHDLGQDGLPDQISVRGGVQSPTVRKRMKDKVNC